MKKIIIFNPRRKNLQKRFNEAVKCMDEELEKGNECDIVLESITGKQVKIVEGYFDIFADCSGMQVELQVEPNKWFNKKILDDLKIKF